MENVKVLKKSCQCTEWILQSGLLEYLCISTTAFPGDQLFANESRFSRLNIKSNVCSVGPVARWCIGPYFLKSDVTSAHLYHSWYEKVKRPRTKGLRVNVIVSNPVFSN